VRVPILAGPLRGRWWLARSRGKIVRVVTGSYEREQTRLMVSMVTAGDAVLDVGAHTGYYTVLASLLVGRAGRVHAFEPDPRNAGFLRRHVRLNRCDNTVVEEVAVASRAGARRFGGGSGSGTARLRPDGALEVPVVALDEYCQRHAIHPTLIKVDVEGGEAEVLRGAAEVLRRDRPTVLLSTHGPEAHAECLSLLSDLGYGAEAVGGGEVATADELLCTHHHRQAIHPGKQEEARG
jgi:FkbM family methyltransferase